VKPAPFEYLRAADVADAVSALAEAAGDGKILAGGQSLVPMLALRLARPTVLVDINGISGLAALTPTGDAVEVGALVRHRRLAEQHEHPLLAEAARWIGHTAIRTRGTVAGSLAHADPSAELPVVALATDATATAVGPRGTRTVPAEELFLAPLMTSLSEQELITAVRFRRPTRWGFAEFARRHGDFALVVAVVAEIDGAVRLALGGVGPVPRRTAAAEAVLAAGGRASVAADAAAAEIDPTADLHGSVAFRRALTAEMVRRALAAAGID
jgi:carbon-monoxide dehydrogenase medium subunit